MQPGSFLFVRFSETETAGGLLHPASPSVPQMGRETAIAIPKTQKGPLRPFERGLDPLLGEP